MQPYPHYKKKWRFPEDGYIHKKLRQLILIFISTPVLCLLTWLPLRFDGPVAKKKEKSRKPLIFLPFIILQDFLQIYVKYGPRSNGLTILTHLPHCKNFIAVNSACFVLFHFSFKFLKIELENQDSDSIRKTLNNPCEAKKRT